MNSALNPSAPMTSRVMQRTTAFARYLQMLRQFNGVGAAIRDLDPAERRKIALTALAELTRAEGSSNASPEKDNTDWSVEAAVAFARVRSQHQQVRVTGIRGWLIAAYRATFQSPYGEVQTLHRQVLRALRTMHGGNVKENSPFTWLESA
jgi:hypothetical protein